jgi:hypothetical protein
MGGDEMKSTKHWGRIGAILIFSLAMISVSAQAVSPPKTAQGCPPDFWVTHLKDWKRTGYSPDQTVGSVFVVPPTFPDLEGATLLEALKFRGGPDAEGVAQVLLREGYAALLNVVHPAVNYPTYTPVDILLLVDVALTTSRGDMLAQAAQLKARNRLGCPLN